VSLSRLLGTASFRLAATYLVMFSASVALLGAVVYFSVGYEIVRQLDDRLIEETAKLTSYFKKNGLTRLAEHISARQAPSSTTGWKTAAAGSGRAACRRRTRPMGNITQAGRPR